MDSGALLDLLGNENRRRILRLLAQKPCYVTEISEYLGVSAKAVIDHLRRLEEAGIVESEVDERRRKYFRIARNVRLEVNVSPYGFGTKSAYPASTSLDLARCRHLSIDIRPGETENPVDVAEELAELRELERELSLAQRWVQGQIADRQAELADAIPDDDAQERLYGELLVALARETQRTEELVRTIDAPAELVEQALSMLADWGLVEHRDGRWRMQR
ncbi:MAG: ArsR/SmtB family transcription factor [Halobacteriaceae archaeon]